MCLTCALLPANSESPSGITGHYFWAFSVQETEVYARPRGFPASVLLFSLEQIAPKIILCPDGSCHYTSMNDFVDTNLDLEDRNETKYFHGRTGILDSFQRRLKWAEKDPKKGTTFLIQAAPGAGKSALLYKCAEMAEKANWQVAHIGPSELCETNTLLHTLGLKKETQTKATTTSVDAHSKAGFLDVVKAGMGFSRSTTKAHTKRSPLEVLKDREGKLLLIMDEAQDFARDFAPSPSKERRDARALIDSVHNGKIAEKPVMLLTAGLIATKRAFKDMGVPRFKDNCYVELGPLKPEAERAVIQDWLQLEGRAKGDPTPWIEAIMQKTHGWPQHVAAYAESAAIHLRATGRQMTPEKLKEVLEVGEMKRIKFYKSRADGLDEDHRTAIARAFASARKDQTQTRKAIMASLLQDVEKQEASEIFELALDNGVIDNRNGRYAIPIPSMFDWFINNYFIDRDPPDTLPPSTNSPPDRPLD